MMKLSDIIEKLQEVHAKHPGICLAVEATGRSDDDGEVCSVIGNEFVSLDVEKDADGYWACLVTKTD